MYHWDRQNARSKACLLRPRRGWAEEKLINRRMVLTASKWRQWWKNASQGQKKIISCPEQYIQTHYTTCVSWVRRRHWVPVNSSHIHHVPFGSRGIWLAKKRINKEGINHKLRRQRTLEKKAWLEDPRERWAHGQADTASWRRWGVENTSCLWKHWKK